jgi:hypothetical protein
MSTIYPIVVFSILQAGFEIVHVKPETREEEEEHEPLKPSNVPPAPIPSPSILF